MSVTHRARKAAALGSAALILAALLSACAGSGSDPGTDDDPYRVVVIGGGPADDRSWTNSLFNGIALVDDPNIEVEFVGSLISDADVVQQGSAYASRGYDLAIITAGFQTAAATQLAEQFPEMTVCQGPVAATEEDLAALLPNQCVWNVKQQEANFLAGALAGIVTESNKISAISGGDFPAMWKETEGYTLGALCANPDVTVTTQVTGSFTDVAAAQSVATAQVGAGSDVILSAVNTAVAGIYSVASSSPGVWVIPSYFDDFESAPEVVLTSTLHSLDRIVADIIDQGASGEISPRDYLSYDIANFDAGSIAEVQGAAAEQMTPEMWSAYEDIYERVREGSIVIPADDSATPLTFEGAASTIDLTSIGC